ncbi:MAG TPA: glycosyltransferase family 4 protein [Rectinemataceae bacterium]|nr:glycosyltransferase family 4 protein [Rectinemataceae bacterium]
MTAPASPGNIAFLGDYPPRLCGIATFTADLCEAVAEAAPGSSCYAGAVNDRAGPYAYPPRVRFEIDEKDLDSYRRAADFLNFENAQILCLQHEFGIYGGSAGSHILALLREVRMPVVTTLHTLLRNPDADQHALMIELAKRSDRLVVMARMGAEILREIYGIAPSKIDVIPHGIPNIPFADSSLFKAQFGVEGKVVLLTFGLLGPGKGIEYAIEALPEIVARHPDVIYLILGATHPHLVAREGESYRLGLERLAEDRGVKDSVIFFNRYVSLDDLKEFIGAADIYLTPYLNEEQITSGTLAYVFGAGKAVVSTPYWHAKELLGEGRGELVPFRDAGAIARGVCAFLDEPERLLRVRGQAYQMGREMIWPAVATRYLESFARASRDRKANPRAAFAGWTVSGRPYDLPPLRLDHIDRLTEGAGILQHAIFTVPNFQEGYSVDDNARAFILCDLLGELAGQARVARLDSLATRYLAYVSASFNPLTGRFRNFMSHSHVWLEERGSEDCHARALWALGLGASRSKNEGHRKLCLQLFPRALSGPLSFSSPRAWAFSLLGIHEFLCRLPDNAPALEARVVLAAKLVRLWTDHASKDWPWFEPKATYENPRLCQALILSGRAMADPEALEIGLASLRWLASIQKTQAGNFRPIGSNGFYEKGGAHAHFDQQPVEAHAMVSACLEAFHATGAEVWKKEAKRAFEWFLGRNDLGLPLYDASSGGCADGLHADRVNENQGAESTLAFQLSLAEMQGFDQMASSPPERES